MCLTEVLSQEGFEITPNTGRGFKVLHGDSMDNSLYGNISSRPYKLKKWYNSFGWNYTSEERSRSLKVPTIEASNGTKYDAHFHIWIPISKTESHTLLDFTYLHNIYLVEFKDPTCIGVQSKRHCVVAKRMRILRKAAERDLNL